MSLVAAPLVLGAVFCGDDPARPSPILQVTAIQPNSGPTDSSTPVRIIGSGFEAGTTVTVDGTRLNAAVANGTQINATMPPHGAGPVDIVVTSRSGQTATLTGGYTHVTLSLTSVTPTTGLAGFGISILGAGIASGATVTMGGMPAAVRSAGSTTIVVTAPVHAEGPVDVVVTNPGGSTAMLAGAFTYEVITLTADPPTVPAGGQLTIAWSRSYGGFDDWIGLFRIGEPNTGYVAYQYVGAPGKATFQAPTAPGQYEFRYLPNDGYVDIARSNVVTVTGAPLPPVSRF